MAAKVLETLKAAKKYKQLYDSAASRRIEFSLTFSEVKALTKAKFCYYTGEPFSDTVDANKRTVDRLDGSKGYVSGNVVACLHRINNLKARLFEGDENKPRESLSDVKYLVAKM